MAIVNLTKAIENESGYIDEVVDQIKSVPKGETLEMHVTCEGGDTFQGARLHRAIMEHEGQTKFVGIGLAASMGGVLISAFDEVEMDEDLDLMLHKAHIPSVPVDELDESQKTMISRFNKRAYAKLLSRGVDEDFLNKVFLSDNTDDHWLTAKEAEALGIGNVVRIERRDSKPFKMAAELKLKFNKMFGTKNKGVLRTATLKDGRTVAFTSEKETIAKGDTVQLVGSAELLTGKVELENNLVMEMAEGNVVDEIEEVEAPKAEVTPEQIEELMLKVAEMEKALSEIIKGKQSDEEMEAKAEAEAEAKAEDEDKMENTVKAAQDILNQFTKAAASLKSDFKLEAPDNKHEKVDKALNHLSEGERRGVELQAVINGIKN